jgi:Phospholipase B
MVMQTAPGWIASMSDFWVTSAGLAIAETTIGGYDGFKGYDETRVPEFVRARKASQYARDVDHWVAMLNTDNNGGYANSWLLGDVKTGEIARYEEGLLYQSLSRTTDGYFWGDNQPVDPRIRNLECFGTGFSDVRTPNGAREVRWRQLLGQYNGSVDAEVGKRMLGDTFDTYLGYIHPSARTICAHSDVDPCFDSGLTPFTPFGSVDGKVVSSADIRALSLWARSGRADGAEFDAEEFLRRHPQWDWQRGYLKDRPQQPWTYVESGSTGGL